MAGGSLRVGSGSSSFIHGLSKNELADLASVYSNHWDLPFTPDELRKLAEVGDRDDGLNAPVSYRAHELSKRLGAEKVGGVVRRAKAGESVRSLARELGVSNSALTRMLREEGVVIQRRTVSAEDEQALARAYDAGNTIAGLEKQFKLSHGAVIRALHRAGVEMRAKAPRKK